MVIHKLAEVIVLRCLRLFKNRKVLATGVFVRAWAQETIDSYRHEAHKNIMGIMGAQVASPTEFIAEESDMRHS